jgi:hypothetical protein
MKTRKTCLQGRKVGRKEVCCVYLDVGGVFVLVGVVVVVLRDELLAILGTHRNLLKSWKLLGSLRVSWARVSWVRRGSRRSYLLKDNLRFLMLRAIGVEK